MIFFLQASSPTIYDKFDGLNRIGERSDFVPPLLQLALLIVAVAGAWYLGTRFRGWRRPAAAAAAGAAVATTGGEEKRRVSRASPPLERLPESAVLNLVYGNGRGRSATEVERVGATSAGFQVRPREGLPKHVVDARMAVSMEDDVVQLIEVSPDGVDADGVLTLRSVVGGRSWRIDADDRVFVSLPAMINTVLGVEGRAITGHIIDVSLSGVGVQVEEPINADAKVTVHAALGSGGDFVSMSCRVRKVGGKSNLHWRAALDFVDDDPLLRARVADLIHVQTVARGL